MTRRWKIFTTLFIPTFLSNTKLIQILTSPTVAPLALLRKETRLSAGWETIAQETPAIYPPAKLTPSCKGLLHSFFGLGMTCLYMSSTRFSNVANFIIVSVKNVNAFIFFCLSLLAKEKEMAIDKTTAHTNPLYFNLCIPNILVKDSRLTWDLTSPQRNNTLIQPATTN